MSLIQPLIASRQEVEAAFQQDELAYLALTQKASVFLWLYKPKGTQSTPVHVERSA